MAATRSECGSGSALAASTIAAYRDRMDEKRFRRQSSWHDSRVNKPNAALKFHFRRAGPSQAIEYAPPGVASKANVGGRFISVRRGSEQRERGVSFPPLMHEEGRRQPKKDEESPESVTAVIITDEPSAGSRPNFIIVMGIRTPMDAASTRFKVIASTMTSPSATSLYSSIATIP